jgi:hypothetical protein
MKNKSLIIIITQSLLIIGLLWLIIYLSKDEIFRDGIDSNLRVADEFDAESLVSIHNKIITLSDSMVKNSGINVQPISDSRKRSSNPSYGYVVNLKNLIDYQTNYLNLNFEINKLNLQLKEELVHFKILQSLNEDNKYIADSVVFEKEIEINNLHNNLDIQKNNKNNLLRVIGQEWGQSFKDLLTDPKKSLLQNIFNSDSRLIKITIANNKIQKLPPSELILFSPLQPQNKYKANLISKAPFGSLDIQGSSYFYLTLSNDLMIGSKINAHIESAEDSQVKKFHIPKSAIIWNEGKPWIYVESSNNSFLRHPIFKLEEVNDGWVVQFENIPPWAIVTKGAQLLLSEEYKHLITNENED